MTFFLFYWRVEPKGEKKKRMRGKRGVEPKEEKKKRMRRKKGVEPKGRRKKRKEGRKKKKKAMALATTRFECHMHPPLPKPGDWCSASSSSLSGRFSLMLTPPFKAQRKQMMMFHKNRSTLKHRVLCIAPKEEEKKKKKRLS